MPYHMYVSLQDDDKISVFGVDAGTGKLTPKEEVPIAGGPSSSAISPDRKVLYVGHRNSNEMSSFRIDPDTGGLTQIGRVSLPASPTFLSTDRNGRFVLSAYYQGAHVAVHSIADDGSVSDPPIEWLETANKHFGRPDYGNRESKRRRDLLRRCWERASNYSFTRRSSGCR